MSPSGHVQDWESIEEVIRFAAAERLLLLVDEVITSSIFRLGFITRRPLCSSTKSLFFCAEGAPGQRVWTGPGIYFLQESSV